MQTFFLRVAMLALIIAPIGAQSINPATQITWPRVTGAGAPTATCPSSTNTTTTATLGTPYTDTTNSNQYTCMSSGWVQINGGGAGGGITQLTGDVHAGPGSGSQTSTVVGLKAVPFCTGFTPTNGQALEYTTASSPNPCYTAATPSGGVVSINSVLQAHTPLPAQALDVLALRARSAQAPVLYPLLHLRGKSYPLRLPVLPMPHRARFSITSLGTRSAALRLSVRHFAPTLSRFPRPLRCPGITP